MQVIEVRDKKFVLDCREEKTGATICEAHRDWGRGEITEVGVAKLRGDVQVLAQSQVPRRVASVSVLPSASLILVPTFVYTADNLRREADACQLQAKPERCRPA